MVRTCCRFVLALGALAFAGGIALADPIFPKASGVGLEPPPGMSIADSFLGFQKGLATILIVEFPKEAFAQLTASRPKFVAQLQDGTTADFSTTAGVSGFMVRGRQASLNATFRKWALVLDAPTETAMVTVQIPVADDSVKDSAVEDALKSIVVRGQAGIVPQVDKLPFTVGDMQGFTPVATLGGTVLLMTDKAEGAPANPPAQVLVVYNHTAPSAPADRLAFARALLNSVKAVTVDDVMAEKRFTANGTDYVELGGAGHEGTKTPVDVSFYVGFRDNDYVMILGTAPPSAKGAYGDKFKAVAVAVKPKG